MKAVAELVKAKKEYKSGDTLITALEETSVKINDNQLTLIIGPSGSGKTTLISLLGCVIYPTSGTVIVNEKPVNGLSEKELAAIRLHHIGFVFQNFNLIQPLSAIENVMMPLSLMHIPRKEAYERAFDALENMDMGNRIKNLPKMLSGGQQQRVSIARALVTNPSIILCDEPTASLDSKSIYQIMGDLKNLSKSDKAVVIVTHDERLREFADRIIYVIDGKASEKAPADSVFK
mgnify:CR=1 FL=1